MDKYLTIVSSFYFWYGLGVAFFAFVWYARELKP